MSCLLSLLAVAEFYKLGHIQGMYYKGALTQKISFLVICTTFRSDFRVGWKSEIEHSTLNSSFDALSKWHEPDMICPLPDLSYFTQIFTEEFTEVIIHSTIKEKKTVFHFLW